MGVFLARFSPSYDQIIIKFYVLITLVDMSYKQPQENANLCVYLF